MSRGDEEGRKTVLKELEKGKAVRGGGLHHGGLPRPWCCPENHRKARFFLALLSLQMHRADDDFLSSALARGDQIRNSSWGWLDFTQ